MVDHEIDGFIDFEKTSVFEELIDQKWMAFARRHHILREIVPFGLFLGLLTVASMYRVAAVWELRRESHYDRSSLEFYNYMLPRDHPEWYTEIARLLYYIVFIAGIPFLLLSLISECRFKMTDLDPNEDLELSFLELMFFFYKNLSLVLTLILVSILSTHVALWAKADGGTLYNPDPDLSSWEVESILMAIQMVIAWLKMMHFLLPFRTMGTVLITVWRMITGDVAKWLCIYIFIVIGFSLATSIITRKNFLVHEDLIMSNPEALAAAQKVVSPDMPYIPFDQMLTYSYVMLGEVGHLATSTKGLNTEDQIFIHVVFIIMSTLLLLNLIIAMMGDTYGRERQKEGFAMWWMHHASMVIKYERRLNQRDRERFRFGIDSAQGEDHPNTRPFFRTSVGLDESLEGAWSIAPKSVTTEDLLKSSSDHFHIMEDSLEVLNKVLRGAVDVRYKRLDAKLNTLFRILNRLSDARKEPRNDPSAPHNSRPEDEEEEAREFKDGGLGGSDQQGIAPRVHNRVTSKSTVTSQSTRQAGPELPSTTGRARPLPRVATGITTRAPSAPLSPSTADLRVRVLPGGKETESVDLTRAKLGRGAGPEGVVAEGDAGGVPRGGGGEGGAGSKLTASQNLVRDRVAGPEGVVAEGGEGGVPRGGGGEGGKMTALPQNLVQDLFRQYDREQTGTLTREHVQALFLEVLAKMGGPHGGAGGNLQQVVSALVVSQHGPTVTIRFAKVLSIVPFHRRSTALGH